MLVQVGHGCGVRGLGRYAGGPVSSVRSAAGGGAGLGTQRAGEVGLIGEAQLGGEPGQTRSPAASRRA
jgi:hypothetical protein